MEAYALSDCDCFTVLVLDLTTEEKESFEKMNRFELNLQNLLIFMGESLFIVFKFWALLLMMRSIATRRSRNDQCRSRFTCCLKL